MIDYKMDAGISIVICCYNSATRIASTLQFIKHQKMPKSLFWEVILVNNASTDDTVEVARHAWLEDNPNRLVPFSIVLEPQPGLTAARRKGVMASRYKYVIFCDDDNWLSNNYAESAYNLMENNSSFGVIGGIGFPEFETERPSWFEKYSSYYAVGSQGRDDVSIDDITDKDRYVYGASSVFRKEALVRLIEANYPFICSDRTKSVLSSGGDNELCYCISLLGYRIGYSSILTFRHFIPTARLTSEYFDRLNVAFGSSAALLQSYGRVFDALKEYKLVWWYQISVAAFLQAKAFFFWVTRSNKMSYFDFRIRTLNRLGVISSAWKHRKLIKKQLAYIESLKDLSK